MTITKMKLARTLAIVTALSSTAARPCSIKVPEATQGVFPFEGAHVPRNVELRGVGPFGGFFVVVGDVVASLSGPDGAIDVRLELDDISPIFVTDTELAPGDWTLHLDARDVVFTVDDVTDSVPPVITSLDARRHGAGEIFPIDSCDTDRHTEITVQVEVEGPDAALANVVNQPRFAFQDGQTTTTATNFNDADDVDVVVRDFAGNIAEASVAVEGCGCSSVPGAVTPTMVVLWALVRRRRPSRARRCP